MFRRTSIWFLAAAMAFCAAAGVPISRLVVEGAQVRIVWLAASAAAERTRQGGAKVRYSRDAVRVVDYSPCRLPSQSSAWVLYNRPPPFVSI